MQQMSDIVPGQRWMSETEPELGLGILIKVEFKRVEMMFPAAGEQRQYALDSAPLRRVALKTGEMLETHDGESLEVDAVNEKNGLLTYRCGDKEVEEAMLSDTMSFSRPEDRLLGGRTDDLRNYDLRLEALQHQCRTSSSPVRGLLGGRVDPIPHQIYIAGEVSSRLAPRVLLADEVGLGKTIEACLIMHRLHLTGRADRVLILVPEPLLHQWFVELLRRFNLLFSLFDEERCRAIESGAAQGGLLDGEVTNPFLDSQLVLASTDFLTSSTLRADQAVSADWDMLIVDEAHHLEWSEEHASDAYQVVEKLARKTEALLLLTATPRQLGAEGHFARLRLLDPERYTSLTKFQEEAGQYEAVAEAVDRLLDGQPLSSADRELFTAQSERVHDHCLALDGGDETAREPLARELLDAFGTGRVMFRNTRSSLSGFPQRRVHLHETEDSILWLVDLLKQLGEEKILLICRSQELAEQIPEQILQHINIKAGHFHEGMTLLQRDRAAAYFAEEDGARILVCSEIGSEGRNFQFAHHLVLFDLPENPELLEQRIGRLDRIGQSETINIHVPYQVGTRGEFLARWYHEGLDAFEHSLHGATEILKELDGIPGDGADLETFINRTRSVRQSVGQKLEKGYDRLLEINSSRPELAEETISKIDEADGCRVSEDFLLQLWDYFGLHVEELSGRSYLLQAGHLITDAFPELPDDGLNCTFDRVRALSREDTTLMSWDHPMARSAMELLLTSEAGNSSFGVMENAPHKAILLESVAVVECIAPAALHADRFMPATPIRVQVDHQGNDLSQQVSFSAEELRPGNLHKLLEQEAFRRKILPSMVEQCRQLATAASRLVIDKALKTAEQSLTAEIDRLTALGEINDHVSESEINALRKQRSELLQVIGQSRIRLDAVRLVWCQ